MTSLTPTNCTGYFREASLLIIVDEQRSSSRFEGRPSHQKIFPSHDARIWKYDVCATERTQASYDYEGGALQHGEVFYFSIGDKEAVKLGMQVFAFFGKQLESERKRRGQ
ncbi:hypothetical protein E1B28_008955 [Marasmius oreades]|uniref:Uncharacterized protein n=1 Tax=Marasmius oreades TaxID=181124 RepID=A0A9P7USA2_9AGAR|nr:uncharacterized protein E1B28_008955 [Marasmius oreades]KAG7092612.1 hypothetical protein E1B28_008955 [Marasmius oreades]